LRPESARTLVERGRPATGSTPRVGVLVPWANRTVEEELPQLCRSAAIFHYARLVPEHRGTALDDQFLGELRAAVPGALEQLKQLPLDGVFVACTSAGFTATDDDIASPATAFDALVASLLELRATHVVVLTPYPHTMVILEAAAFARNGIHVLGGAGLGRDDQFCDVTRAEVQNLVRDIPPTVLASAHALVLSCTAWPTINLLTDLEEELQIPVISSNLAMAIQASRLTPGGQT